MGANTALACGPFERNLDHAPGADLFAGYVPTFQSGDTLPKVGVFAIALQPVADIVYFVLANAGAATGYGGIVTFESLVTGRYSVVLSQDAQGVVSIKEGAWITPGEDGTDIAGCANVLAEDRSASGSEKSGLTR